MKIKKVKRIVLKNKKTGVKTVLTPRTYRRISPKRLG